MFSNLLQTQKKIRFISKCIPGLFIMMLVVIVTVSNAGAAGQSNTPQADYTIKAEPLSTTFAEAFPDNFFRNTVFHLLGDDRTEDSLITDVDRAILSAVTELEMRTFTRDLTGIEYFTGLLSLNVDWCPIRTVDLSKNMELVYLSCNNNFLAELDLSRNKKLTQLGCYNNILTELDLSENTALSVLNCGENYLTTLDLSKNTALYYLDCSYNRLTSLVLPESISFQSLNCSCNSLKRINVSKYPALRSLHCYNNQLNELDVSKNTELVLLYCENNQLTKLYISNNTKLQYVICYSNFMSDPNDVIGWRESGLLINSPENIFSRFWYYDQREATYEITIVKQPEDIGVISGSISGSLTVDAYVTSEETPDYQWYEQLGDVPNSATDTPLGAGVIFTIPVVLKEGTHYYYCSVNALDAKSVISRVARVTVNSDKTEEYIRFTYDEITADSLIPGKTLNIEAVYAVNNDRIQSMIAALYKKNGALIKCTESRGIILNRLIYFNSDIEIPEIVEDGAYIKMFFWDSLSYAPIRGAIDFL